MLYDMLYRYLLNYIIFPVVSNYTEASKIFGFNYFIINSICRRHVTFIKNTLHPAPPTLKRLHSSSFKPVTHLLFIVSVIPIAYYLQTSSLFSTTTKLNNRLKSNICYHVRCTLERYSFLFYFCHS